GDEELLTLAPEDPEDIDIDVGDLELEDDHAFVRESSDVRRNALTASGALRVDEADADFDVDAFFASVIREDSDPQITPPPPHAPAAPRRARAGRSRLAPRRAAAGAAADAPRPPAPGGAVRPARRRHPRRQAADQPRPASGRPGGGYLRQRASGATVERDGEL